MDPNGLDISEGPASARVTALFVALLLPLQPRCLLCRLYALSYGFPYAPVAYEPAQHADAPGCDAPASPAASRHGYSAATLRRPRLHNAPRPYGSSPAYAAGYAALGAHCRSAEKTQP